MKKIGMKIGIVLLLVLFTMASTAYASGDPAKGKVNLKVPVIEDTNQTGPNTGSTNQTDPVAGISNQTDPITGSTNPGASISEPINVTEITRTLGVVNFDAIPLAPNTDQQLINYAGITWDYGLPDYWGGYDGGWWVCNDPSYATPASSPNYVFNGYGAIDPGFSFYSPVDFYGAYFMTPDSGLNPSAVRFVGYVSGVPTYWSSWLTLSSTPTYLYAGFPNVDRVVVEMDGSGWFAMDDLWVNIPAEWTYMVYLDGDNNLEGAAIDDFMEMSSVGSSPTVNIVVQFDRISGYDTSYGDWTFCRRFYVWPGITPTAANAISCLGECNMGDPDTLDEFVTWATTNYPANKYALILWNHGSGWKNWKWNDPDPDLGRGVCWDDTDGGDYLTLRETEQALTGKYVDLIGYDACLMHMMEVVYQVMANAGVSVGSEEVEPGDGWPYDTILADLTGWPTMNEYGLGKVIVHRYIESYAPATDETQSAMDNSNVPDLVTAVDDLAQALINEIPGDLANVQDARFATAEMNWDSNYIDLYHFAENVDLYVSGAATEAQAVMNEMTLLCEAHGTSVPNDHGLSIYFPRYGGSYMASYGGTAFARDTQWNEFLARYYHPIAAGVDKAVYSGGLWFVDKDGDQLADDVFGYGFAGATPLVGDINQDGTDDIAVYSAPLWFVDTNGDHLADDVFGYGFAGARPLVGDIDQDGSDDIAVYSAPLWFVDTNGDHLADDVFGYGFAGATPVVGDINQDMTDDIAVYSAPLWFVDTNGDHLADDVFGYGFAGATPIVGNIG
jgi:hypothetical protein